MNYDVEGAARRLYARAGFATTRAVWTPKIVVGVLGPKCIYRTNILAVSGRGALFTLHGQRKMYLRDDLPDEEIGHVAGHELGHWICERDGYDEPDLEAVCDAIGAALVLPRDAFGEAAKALGGHNFKAMARVFTATESLVALRIGEITGEPIALVSPGKVRTRGQLSFDWGTETDLRRAARGRPRPGLQKSKLSDDARRTVLRADSK